MKESFETALKFVLSQEGGYVDHPNDPGGETKYGISKKAYPNLDIKNLTEQDAATIYKKDYWDKANCDNIEYPLDMIVFDTAVNMGIARALALLEQTKDWRDYLMLRIMRYNDIAAKNPVFLRGWLNRVIALWKKVK